MASDVIFGKSVKGRHADEKSAFRLRIVEGVDTLILVDVIVRTRDTNVLVDIRHASLYLKGTTSSGDRMGCSLFLRHKFIIYLKYNEF